MLILFITSQVRQQILLLQPKSPLQLSGKALLLLKNESDRVTKLTRCLSDYRSEDSYLIVAILTLRNVTAMPIICKPYFDISLTVDKHCVLIGGGG